MIKLSILICTLPESKHHMDNMWALLNPQIAGREDVEVLVDETGRQQPTGTKRNNLIQRATGEWFVFVDCDDWVDPSYVSSIMEALKSDPDVVTFKGWYTENGRNKLNWTIKLGEKYEARHENGEYQMFRWPNHLAVMRKSKVQHIKFPDIWHGEDFNWSKVINDGTPDKQGGWMSGPNPLLQTEVHIDKRLYHYIYIHGK